jgi:hypothetical protein
MATNTLRLPQTERRIPPLVWTATLVCAYLLLTLAPLVMAGL